MKKLVLLLLAGTCLSIGVMLAACDNEKHTHTYETVWSYDDAYHWYACKDEDCTGISQKSEHTFENNECSACGYERSDFFLPTNEVTEEKFNAALSFENVTSVTVQLEDNEGVVNGVRETKDTTVYINQNKGKMASTVTVFYETFDTYAYLYSFNPIEVVWVRQSVERTDDNVEGIETLDTIKERFEGAEFSRFTYEDGYYKYTDRQTEVVVNVSFCFENSRLISARAEFLPEDGDDRQHVYMTFTDYNQTTVSLPTEWREGATALRGNEVTEEQFYKAVSFAGVTSVTASRVATNMVVDGSSATDRLYYSKLWIDGNKMKETEFSNVGKGLTRYYEGFEEYTYIFSQDKANGWQRRKEQYTLGDMSEILELDDANWNFDEWSYADGAYTMTINVEVQSPISDFSENISATGTTIAYTTLATLVFQEDKLYCFRIEAVIDGSLQYRETVLSDYNRTTVELPTEYTDYIEPKPLSKEEWEDIFTPEKFNNISIGATESVLSREIIEETAGGTLIHTQMKIISSTWILIDSGNKIIQWDGEDGVNQEIYYDGENWFYYDIDNEPFRLILLPTDDERYKYVTAWEAYFDIIELSYNIYDELEFDKLNNRYLYNDGAAIYDWSFFDDDYGISFSVTFDDKNEERFLHFSFQNMGDTTVVIPECEKVL